MSAMRYRCIVADPPWSFKDRLPGTKGASSQYPCLDLAALKSWSLPPIADDAYLFLWRVASMQLEALELATVWGFAVKTELVWCKLTRTGKRHFGLGRHLRAEHEVCLVATRGSPKPLNRHTRSVFTGPVREHSRKPDEFYQLVEQFCGGPRVELFARQRRPGWDAIGNEVDRFGAGNVSAG